MGRKRSVETSPVYGSFLVSLLYRSIELMGTGGQVSQHAATLDNTLNSIFEIPEIKELAGTSLERIKSTSKVNWLRGTRKYFRDYSKLYSRACKELGWPDPLRGLRLDDRINYILSEIGWEGSFEGLASEVKRLFINKLEFISSGEKKAIAEWSKDITSGLFEDDPEKAVAMIRLCFLASGGEKLLQEVDDAVSAVRDRLNSSAELQAAVELVEKRQKWGGFASDRKFQKIWKSLQPRVMGRIRGKGLAIPETEALSARGKRSWDEEEALAMRTIFLELLKRAGENPFKLIADAWNSKLGNSLVLAVENDLRDVIRYQRAQKRGVAKKEILDEESLMPRDKRYPQSILDNGPLQKLIEEDDYNSLTKQLNEEEKAIIVMKKEGLTQKEIAGQFGKTQGWVSGKIKGIREKIRPYYRERP